MNFALLHPRFLKVALPAAIVVAMAGVSGCSTDVDVNADYKDITILYGLLDGQDSAHFIKIDKAFLGEDDALVLAQVRDSSEYSDISVKVYEYTYNRNENTPYWENLVDSFVAEPVTVDQDDESIFADQQTVYRFVGNLEQDRLYDVSVVINENETAQKEVTARTPIIGDINITFPAPTWKMMFANAVEFRDQSVRWQAVPNAINYDISVIVPIEETTSAGTALNFYTWDVGSIRTDDSGGGEELEFEIEGEEFFRFLDVTLLPDPGIERRIPDGEIIIQIWAGGEELATYMEVANPASGLIQDKPEYTNVINGFGIWSTRTRQVFRRTLDNSTFDEMISGVVGGYTGDLGFCHPLDPNHERFCP